MSLGCQIRSNTQVMWPLKTTLMRTLAEPLLSLPFSTALQALSTPTASSSSLVQKADAGTTPFHL